ncbi:MAG: AAA family ATPase [Gammaproteobacteria bacterium]|nr:AAA family ATPase [Gammaproteobacteria bacterium]
MPHHLIDKSPTATAEDATAALVRALDNPLAFGHPLHRLRVLETHISWIILTGNYAYKIKKPVNFGFLNFSTLDRRHFYCSEELRLNRRFAPRIYLGLVEIRGSHEAPHLQGDGEVIEYALKMTEFPQQCLLSHHAASGTLEAALIDAIAIRVNSLHADSAQTGSANRDNANKDNGFGTGRVAQRWSEENMTHIADTIPAALLPESYARLRHWYRDNGELLRDIDQRKRDGYVRECHGDLHLGNMALIEGEVTAFDCIEFNPELRWIDTISEAAFVAMDLHARGYPAYCWRFINRYLEISADYGAVKLLRYYFIYRALVRAKVEALRVDLSETSSANALAAFKPALDYIELADQWASRHRDGLIVMHGLSGSGKSTVAAQLVEALGAIQIRSDVIRKQLFDIDLDAPSESGLDGGIYRSDATALTYRKLGEIAATIISADYCVIVDATFLREAQRRRMLELESATPCARIIVVCDAPEAVLRKRIEERENDPSEANLQVLEQQTRKREPISAAEAKLAAIVRVGADGIDNSQIDEIRALLAN